MLNIIVFFAVAAFAAYRYLVESAPINEAL